MADWLVALPCWGEAYRKRFAEQCCPSWRAALSRLTGRVRFIIYTDDEAFCDLFAGYEVDARVRKSENPQDYFGAFADCHREALADARMGELVAIQNGDHILSVESLEAAERRLMSGKKLIMCAGTRTVGAIFGQPPVMPSADLLQWAMHFAHPIIQQSFYPTGRGVLPSVLYFRDDRGNVILRAFHLHPFAVLKDRELDFAGTVDRDLPDNFKPHEIHVVTDKNELAMAEISPMSKRFPLRGYAMDDDYLLWWGAHNASPMHWHFFGHRIVIQGSADTDCDAPADRLIVMHQREAA